MYHVGYIKEAGDGSDTSRLSSSGLSRLPSLHAALALYSWHSAPVASTNINHNSVL